MRATWLPVARAEAEGEPHVVPRLVAGVALAVARRLGVRLPDGALLSAWGEPIPVDVPDGVVADAWLPGEVLEALLPAGERRRRGSHHTPRHVARTVTGLALADDVTATSTVCDPAVGGGAFLLAAAEVLAGRGGDRAGVVRRLSGVDIDPVAVAVTEVALCLWARGRAVPSLGTCDALARPADGWGEPASFVLGNPPFLGQLRSATARARRHAGLRPDLAAVTGAYTDAAALFPVLGLGLVAPGGRVAMVLPRSFLAARDAGGPRSATLVDAVLEHLWLPQGRAFVAGVEVCVPVWRRRRPTDAPTTTRSTGVPPAAAPPVPTGDLARRPTWSHLLAGLDRSAPVPALGALRADGCLGDRCTANAGFRDQYYGLIPFTVDDPDGRLDDATHARLVTAGLVDPAVSAWGARPTRYAGRSWAAPRVDVDAVQAAGGFLARWTSAALVPKLLVAAQTKVVEAVADVDGTWLPSTPVATVVPAPGARWHVLAVLLSPVATAWALHHHRGTALAGDAVRLPPAAIRAMPTPARSAAWDDAAAAVEGASTATSPRERHTALCEAARRSTVAYGLDPERLVPWWAARLPAQVTAPPAPR